VPLGETGSSSGGGPAKQPLTGSSVAPHQRPSVAGKQLRMLGRRSSQRASERSAAPHTAPGRPASSRPSTSSDSSSDEDSDGPAPGMTISTSDVDLASCAPQACAAQQPGHPPAPVIAGAVEPVPLGWELMAAAGLPGVGDLDSASLMLDHLRYEPCCQVVPISIKVSGAACLTTAVCAVRWLGGCGGRSGDGPQYSSACAAAVHYA
jgi:hypothetical protein